MQGKKMGNRILSAILALIMVIGMCPAVPVAANATEDTAANTASGQKLPFHKVEDVDADVRLPHTKVEHEKEEPTYADTDMVRVSIVLNKQATLELYSTTGVADNTAAMAYRERLRKEQTAVIERIERDVLAGDSLDVVWSMTLAANIISANVLYGQLDDIAAIRGVKEVFVEAQYESLGTDPAKADPMMSTSSAMIGSNNAWAAGYTGAGSRIAIIDTGLDLNHQSFNNNAYLYSLQQNAAAKGMSYEEYVASLDLLTKEDVADVLEELNVYAFVEHLAATSRGAYYVNDKVPFAINYVDSDYDVTHDNDTMTDHGSHVAGIAAANRYIPVGNGYASALTEVNMQGVAPDAQIIVMKVFGKEGGAYESDYMVAIEDAIMLGCDAVNLSLGSDKGFGRNSNYQDILDSLADNDVIVAVAAGNAGAWADYANNGTGKLYIEDVDFGMIASPAAATNTMAVASADNVGMTSHYIRLGEEILLYTESTYTDGSTTPPLTNVAGDVNYILIDGIGTAEEVAAVVEAAGGKIPENTVFICSRGTINFGEKATNAVAAGFIATIVYNNAEGGLIMNMDGYEGKAPAVSVSMASGLALKEAAQTVTGKDGNVVYYQGTMYISDKVMSAIVSDNYNVSDFSSWGIPGTLELKPEITAPGGEIYSVNGIDPSGKAYMNNSGTSMASPQIAGMAALVMQYIKETGLDTRLGISSRKLASSLLMSTAEPMKNGDNYFSVMQQGAGLANVGNAILSNSYLWMDENANAGAADGKIKVELGDDPDRDGRYSFSFTLNNFGSVAQIYSVSGDFFTQATTVIDGITYHDTATTALGMGVDFQVVGDFFDASERYACDLNEDGVTDAKDAQIILEYVAGNVAEIAEAADLSKDGTVSTYDAHLLLASIGSGYFMVEPGKSINITVDMTLTESAKEHLDATYPNGAYVEGFVIVEPLVTEEGEHTPAHSIPVLGFYGNWSDAPMYDRLSYHDYVYAMENGTDFIYPYTGYTSYLTFFDEDDYEISFVGNPYVVEDEFPADKIAIRPEMELGDMATSLIRNAGGFLFYVEDEEGNVVNGACSPLLKAAYYYINGGYWNYANTAGLSIWETPNQLGGFVEDDKFTVGFMAVPEYYINTDMTEEELFALMLEMRDSGEIGPGAYYSYTFTVDGTAPELLDVVKLEDGDLKVNVKDNRHVAAVAVLTATGGNTLYATAVDQDTPNTATELIIDMEDIRVNRKCLIMVADYAGNEVFYELEYNDGLSDFDGRMYAFTNAKTRGALNTWMEITVEDLFYNGGDASLEIDPTMGGTLDVASMKDSVLAAEYVSGYVFMVTDKGELRVALQGDWQYSMLAAENEQYKYIKDMAFNTVDKQLYALGADNTVYTIDLYTGAMTKQFTVSIVGPSGADENGFTKNFNDENKKLLTLAIDDEGNFYSVNNGNSTYQMVYLYTWSAEDIKDGAVTDLQPVSNDYYGYTGDYVYNDDMPATGSPTTQSMAWDHDEDVLYWAAALTVASPFNCLYKFDTETGKATIATTGPISGVEDPSCLGCLCCNVSGLYIVPKDDVIKLESADKATGLRLSRNEVSMLQGAQLRLDWDVLPWHLSDKSVTWESSDPSVVKVSDSGLIEAVGVGTATVIMTTKTNTNLHRSCVVTVDEIQNVTLNGMLIDSDEKINWATFDLLNAQDWVSNYVEENYKTFIAGGMHDDVIYTHDGKTMYGIDANTFEVTKYTDIHETWLWSDAAQGPETPKGYFDRLVGIISGGLSIGVMDIEEAMAYEVPHYSDFGYDHAALIAYVGPTTHFDGFETCDAHEYYIMTESGDVYHDIIYAFFDKDMQEVVYSDYLTYVGSTGLNLKGMGNVNSGNRGSLYYDEDTGYLIATLYYKNSQAASVSVFRPDACAPVTVGNFGLDVWPVVSLYAYDALTDLTVKVKPNKAECYVGETVQLNASVYMFESDNGVTWSSSDEEIATVNEKGVVTALKEGTVTITATTKEKRDDGTKATAYATVTVKPLTALDVMLHAYVQTSEGGKWVAVDGNNLDLYKLAESDAKYTGAGVSGGKIYATDETNYYMIDPNGNAYTVTAGDNFTDGKGYPFLYMLDGTFVPEVTRDFVDQATGEVRKDVTVGGMPVYVSGTDETGGNYLMILQDYTTGEFLFADLDAGRAASAVAYHESEESEGYWFDRYFVLGVDGMLEHYELGTYLENGEMLNLGGWAVDYIPIGLEFADNDDLSMVYVETEDFEGVVIAYATKAGTELWCYDVVELELRKMGVLKGVTDLVGLSILTDDMGVTLPEHPEGEEEAEVVFIYGYVKTANGYVWAKINPTTMSFETIVSDANGYTAGAALNGKVIVVTGVTKYGNTSYTFQELDPGKNYAMNATPGDTAHTDGYNPADFAGVPSKTVSLVDSNNGQTYTVSMGGYMIDAANGKYSSSTPKLYLVKNYRNHTTSDAEIYFGSGTFADKFAGIVYTGSSVSEDNKAYYDYFLILDQSGNLYKLCLTSCVKDGKVTLNSARSIEKLSNKLSFAAKNGASITRISDNKAYISVNTSTGTVELYSLDLTTYTAESLGALSGAQTIAGLHSDGELTGNYLHDGSSEPDVPTCDHSNLGQWEFDDNYHWKTCECGETIGKEAHEAQGEWESDASGHWKTCECGKKLEQSAHVGQGEWEYDETNHWKTCLCGEKAEVGEHVFEKGECECGYVDPNYKPECLHTNTKVEGAKDPTCTEPGYTGDTICVDCGETVTKGEEVPATGHVNLNRWQHNATNHWRYCKCGTQVDYGTHTFVNGYCTSCSRPCEHTNVGEWNYIEDRHWRLCECGEYMDLGLHEFVEGVCKCGYADPNYKPPVTPEQPPVNPGEPAGSSNWLHAYVKTETGYAWVMIDSATGEMTVIEEGTANYTGGGYADGKIYTTVNEYGQPTMYVVDPANGYSATAGFMDDINFARMMDATSGPAKTVTINGTEVQVGRPVYVCCDPTMPDYQYIGVIINPATRSQNKFASNEFYDGSMMRGIAFVSAEQAADNSSYTEHFVILFNNGKLYECAVTYKGNTKSDISVTLGDYVETGLDASKGASMTLVAENELCIALTTASGVDLYSYDLATNTAAKLSTVSGAQSLVAADLLANVRPELVPTEPKLFHAYVKTENGYAWVKIDPATGEMTVIEEGTANYTGGGYADGKIYTTVNEYGQPTMYVVDPANGYSATAGFMDDINFARMMDATSGPAKTVTINGTEVQVGRPVYVCCDPTMPDYQYIGVIINPAKRSENKFASNEFYDGSMMRGIAFVSAEQAADNSSYTEHFVILFNNGKLYECAVTYKGNTKSDISVTLGDYVETGLDASKGASMTLVGENELYIALNTASGVDLYSYDLATNTAAKLSTVSGAQSLVALNLLEEVRPDLVEEETEKPADVAYHAYVKTENGYAWVEIDSATGEMTVIKEDTANYTGGGYADGKIYTTVNEFGQPTMYVVDPANGYSATAGFMDDINFARMMDATSGPAKTVTINGTEVQVGRPVYVCCDPTMPDYQYIGVIINPAKRSDNKFASNEFYDGSMMRGIAFVSAEQAADNSSYTEHFVILFNNGKLYECAVTYKGNTKSNISVTLGDYVETGLDASKGASMTLVAENELCIALTTASGVDLYSYDLATNTATKLSTVSGAQSLVALSLLSDVQPAAAKAANVVRGNLMSVYATSGSAEQEGEAVVIANGEVTVQLAETESVTNGLLTVTYDPAVLTFKSLSSAAVTYAVNIDEPGKLVIAYAAASAVSANDVLATLVFAYEGDTVNTAITVVTGQRNDNNEVAEDAVVIPVANIKVDYTSITLEGTIITNYYMTIPETVAENETAYMEITKPNGKVDKVYISDLEKVTYQGGEYYKVSCDMGVSAKEMAEDVVARFYCDGVVLLEKRFCAKDYAEYVLANSDDAALMSLMRAMLHYGAYAQMQFNYNTADLANKDLEDYSNALKAVTAETLSAYAPKPVRSPEGVMLYSVSLLLKSETTMRMFFKLDAGVDADSVTFNGKKADGERDGLYYVDITNIAAKDLDEAFTVTISIDGAEVGAVSYIPMSYCYSVLTGKADENLQNVVKALYLYNQAANAYFAD